MTDLSQYDGLSAQEIDKRYKAIYDDLVKTAGPIMADAVFETVSWRTNGYEGVPYDPRPFPKPPCYAEPLRRIRDAWAVLRYGCHLE